ncbi:MAG: hypothetical protein JXR03_03255 [Cyclobacteriaceae bacterium]
MPDFSEDFYNRSLLEVQKKYEEKPTNRLLKQKLYYFEKLNWPKESITDLNLLLEKNGLDESLVRLFLQYYLNNDRYAELTEVLDKWEFYNGLDEELSQYRVLSNFKANGSEGTRDLILDYVKKFKSVQSYEFAVGRAEALRDTVLLKSFLEDLSSLDPYNSLILKTYIPILLKEQHYNKCYGLLTLENNKPSSESDLFLAKALYGMDSLNRAKSLLAHHKNEKSYLQLSNWYRLEKTYDSSIFYLDKVIVNDSSRSLLLTKAEILDERGWFNSSFSVFNILIERDSLDTIATNKAAIVARKIAYLRNLREAKRDIPIPQILPKKLVE